MDTQESDSVLEIFQAGDTKQWRLEPHMPTEYPIIISNRTTESHEVELTIVDAVDWAVVRPQRLSLRSGKDATAKLVLAKGTDARARAGQHKLTLELLDFEGTSLGQLAATITVVPYYALAMSLKVRGPLLRRGVVEGFVLHCTVVNHGNAECTIHPEGEADSPLELSAPTVRVPFAGDLSFDIEAWWRENPMRSYPASVRLNASYPEGDASAEVPWSEVVAAIGSMIPPLADTQEFPDVLQLEAVRKPELHPVEHTTLQAPVESITAEQSLEQAESVAAKPGADARMDPMFVQIAPLRPMKYTYGMRVNPWWPPAERFGGRWRFKPLPIAAVALAISLVAMARFGAFDSARSIALNPDISIHTLFNERHEVSQTRHSAVPTKLDKSQRSKHALRRPVVASGTSSENVPPQPQRSGGVSRGEALPAVAMEPAQAKKEAKGEVWEGDVVHVSAGNIKVIDSADDVRSFIVSQDFKSVFSADGTAARNMSDVVPGTQVRVFYSYVFGFRHPNAIFILSGPKANS